MDELIMQELIRILVKNEVNFSVEFFSTHVKVRVRQTGVWWSEDSVLERTVFVELKENGFNHAGIRMTHGATPTAVVTYIIQ